jgi:hypothetical protein
MKMSDYKENILDSLSLTMPEVSVEELRVLISALTRKLKEEDQTLAITLARRIWDFQAKKVEQLSKATQTAVDNFLAKKI